MEKVRVLAMEWSGQNRTRRFCATRGLLREGSLSFRGLFFTLQSSVELLVQVPAFRSRSWSSKLSVETVLVVLELKVEPLLLSLEADDDMDAEGDGGAAGRLMAELGGGRATASPMVMKAVLRCMCVCV